MLNLQPQLTVEQRLQKNVTDIYGVDIYAPLAGVVALGISALDDGVPTAMTNGRDVIYGSRFIPELNDAEFRFLILHENYHKLGRHLHIYLHLFKIDPKLAGISCDEWINNTLTIENDWIMANVPEAKRKWPSGFATMPKGGFCTPKYIGWDIAKIFWDLKQRQDEGEDISEDYGDGEGNQPIDEHDWEGAEELNAVEKEDLAREIESAVRQGNMVAGRLGLQSNRTITELMTPKVPWEKVAKDWAQQVCSGKEYSTWSRPNRRHLGQGVYMPTTLGTKMEHLVLAPDMSGSCYEFLGQWLGEFKKIAMTLRPTTLHLIWWDTEVAGHEEFHQDKLDDIDGVMRNLVPKGGGGTDVRCVPKYLRDKKIIPTACAVLTDGELFGGWGNWDCPVLWCVANNEQARPAIGKTVHIKV